MADDTAHVDVDAVNLGSDADTVGAVYGQIAGAFYGSSSIPMHWKSRVALAPLLDAFARELHHRASGGTTATPVCTDSQQWPLSLAGPRWC